MKRKCYIFLKEIEIQRKDVVLFTFSMLPELDNFEYGKY